MNLWSVYRRTLAHHRDRAAVTTEAGSWTYGELGDLVGHVSARLAAAGVEPGSRVVLLMDNGVGYLAADLAIASRGAVKTPLNMMMSTGEVERAVEFVQPTAIVFDRQGRERLPELPAQVTQLELVPGWEASVPATELPAEVAVAGDAPAGIYLSGGTTGKPKGIMHSQSTVLTNIWAHLIDSGINGDSRLLLTTPLPHSAGLFAASALVAGARVWIESGFDARRWVDLVEEHQITWSYGVPTMLKRILDLKEGESWHPRSIATYQYGSAPMSPGLLRRALEVFGPVLQQLYAQTECPQYATLLRKSDHVIALERPDLLASAGRPTAMCEVSVRGPGGEVLGPDDVGEVCLRSPYVMTGYWQDPEGYAERFYGDWLRTGDVGRIDADGYLFLVDRLADMIVSGGMNVYGIEVEAALSLHPAVAQAAVIGVPDEEWGERVHAVVVKRSEVSEAELVEHCRASLASYKRPKGFEVVDALPLTTYGKVDKKALRAPHWAGRNRSVN